MTLDNSPTPGPIVLFGSGETLPPSGKAHEYVAQNVGSQPKIAILETPAGFEPNSDAVAGAVGKFLARRLQNYRPQIKVIPARKKNSNFSVDDAKLLGDMLDADWVFMGPGSPTYAVRQLTDSRAWQYLVALHRLGVPISLASAAVLAISVHTLPVYEIYKVGEDLHWKSGLNFLKPFGLECIFIPHWNNNDGGDDLDTSRCFMGQKRFNQLVNLLPEPYPIIGIDEHTALVIDFDQDCGCVLGSGSVTVIQGREEQKFESGSSFSLHILGDYVIPDVKNLVSPSLHESILIARQKKDAVQKPDEQVEDLVSQREAARKQRNWEEADRLRVEIEKAGWELRDTPEGPELVAQSSEATS